MKKIVLLLLTAFVLLSFASCSVSNYNNKSTDEIPDSSISSTNKIIPSSELINIYAKTHYDYKFDNGNVVFTDLDYNPKSETSTWTVAWYEDDKTPKMESANLIIKADDKEIYNKPLDIVKIENENDFIHHGWNYYVLIDEIFSAECDETLEPKAFIKFCDSNGVEYKVLLELTEINEPIGNTADYSNEILITDKNATYSIWDVTG